MANENVILSNILDEMRQLRQATENAAPPGPTPDPTPPSAMREKALESAKNLRNAVISGFGIAFKKTGLSKLASSVGNFAKMGGKGILLSAALVAFFAFVNSPFFDKFVDFLRDKIIPGIGSLIEWLDKNGINISNAIGFISAGLANVGSLITNVLGFFQDPSWENFTKIFDENLGTLVVGIAGITALLAPKLLFKGITKGIGLFAKAIMGAGKFLARKATDVVTGTRRDSDGRLRNTRTGRFAPNNARGIGAIGRGALRGIATGAKFIPGVGLAVTAAMGIFDGMSAGIEEYKKSGKIGAAVKEGFAGTLSGLSFGLIPQKSISGFFDTVGENTSKAFGSSMEKLKEVGGTLSEKFTSIKESAMGKLNELEKLAAPGLEKLKDIGGRIKEKFKGLKDKAIAFMGNIGDKISGFFGFGKEATKVPVGPTVSSIHRGRDAISGKHGRVQFGSLSKPLQMAINERIESKLGRRGRNLTGESKTFAEEGLLIKILTDIGRDLQNNKKTGLDTIMLGHQKFDNPVVVPLSSPKTQNHALNAFAGL